jgi:hypothetical protein
MKLVEAVFIPLDAARDNMGWSKTGGQTRLSVIQKLLADPRARRVPTVEVLSKAAR